MITYLTGKLTELSHDPPRAVVLTAGGVGYAVSLPVFVSNILQSQGTSIGEEIELHIFYSVSERQPLPFLVGFTRTEDRTFFEQFLQVEGIGPAKAVNALTASISQIASAIETEDTMTLTSLPGIGPRAAQKIVATLKGKVSEAAAMREDDIGIVYQQPGDARTDVIGVLVGLGYRASEAQRLVHDAVRSYPDASEDSQELLQHVFRSTSAPTGAQNSDA